MGNGTSTARPDQSQVVVFDLPGGSGLAGRGGIELEVGQVYGVSVCVVGGDAMSSTFGLRYDRMASSLERFLKKDEHRSEFGNAYNMWAGGSRLDVKYHIDDGPPLDEIPRDVMNLVFVTEGTRRFLMYTQEDAKKASKVWLEATGRPFPMSSATARRLGMEPPATEPDAADVPRTYASSSSSLEADTGLAALRDNGLEPFVVDLVAGQGMLFHPGTVHGTTGEDAYRLMNAFGLRLTGTLPTNHHVVSLTDRSPVVQV